MKFLFSALTAGLVSASVLASVATARAETLTDTLIAAYQNSNLLEQNRALLRAADEDVAQAVAALRPVLAFVAQSKYTDRYLSSVGGISSYDTENSVALSAEITLYDNGANRLAVDSAKESVLATRADLVNVEQQVLLSAVQAYMDVRSAIRNVDLKQSNVRLISQELDATLDRFDVGEVTRTDVSIAEAALAAARSGLVAAEGELVAAREAFKLAVGRYPGPLKGTPPKPSLPASLDGARTVAVKGHPSVVSAQHNVRVSELNASRARAALGPTVRAGASLGANEYGDDSSEFSLTLNQPIYTGGKLRAVARQATHAVEATRAGLLQSVRLVDRDVGNAWAQLSVARSQLAASDGQIRAAQLAFEGTQDEARLGSRTTLDVLDAEQDLLDARTTRVTAEANEYKALYAVLASMGLLTAEHLDLGVPIYDPVLHYNAVKNAPISIQGEKLQRIIEGTGRK
ncbi:outer membrane protein [Rhodovulum imhoffii]|uniref:Outer membrane protein n=1 Tax=Rhodovulum imhoffii TaxID=365340 RepID=A0A2T5BR89_9RHOB|nr:TolC family outer membrane protein [Rhodovulum imhoffii]MBK5934974.1 transporter [Rhodovulum imhoffii]PTN01675.1 outer membrane protein [Rhodovulum imhoffii]